MLIAKTLKLMKSETKIAITKPGIAAASGTVAAVMQRGEDDDPGDRAGDAAEDVVEPLRAFAPLVRRFHAPAEQVHGGVRAEDGDQRADFADPDQGGDHDDHQPTTRGRIRPSGPGSGRSRASAHTSRAPGGRRPGGRSPRGGRRRRPTGRSGGRRGPAPPARASASPRRTRGSCSKSASSRPW